MPGGGVAGLHGHSRPEVGGTVFGGGQKIEEPKEEPTFFRKDSSGRKENVNRRGNESECLEKDVRRRRANIDFVRKEGPKRYPGGTKTVHWGLRADREGQRRRERHHLFRRSGPIRRKKVGRSKINDPTSGEWFRIGWKEEQMTGRVQTSA